MLAVPYPRKAILFVLFAIVAVTAIGGVAFAIAQGQRTANVEVRVWEDVNDPERNFISARPEGGSWSTLGTIRLPLTDGVSSSGRFRYGDITLAVPLPDAGDDEYCAAAVSLAEATADVSIVSCVSREMTDGYLVWVTLWGVLSYRGELYSFSADTYEGVQIHWTGVGSDSPACRDLERYYRDGFVQSCTATARLSWVFFEDEERALVERATIGWIASGSIGRNTRVIAFFDSNQSIWKIERNTTEIDVLCERTC